MQERYLWKHCLIMKVKNLVEDRLVLNLTYYSLLRNFQKVLYEAVYFLHQTRSIKFRGETFHDWLVQNLHPEGLSGKGKELPRETSQNLKLFDVTINFALFTNLIVALVLNST